MYPLPRNPAIGIERVRSVPASADRYKYPCALISPRGCLKLLTSAIWSAFRKRLALYLLRESYSLQMMGRYLGGKEYLAQAAPLTEMKGRPKVKLGFPARSLNPCPFQNGSLDGRNGASPRRRDVSGAPPHKGVFLTPTSEPRGASAIIVKFLHDDWLIPLPRRRGTGLTCTCDSIFLHVSLNLEMRQRDGHSPRQMPGRNFLSSRECERAAPSRQRGNVARMSPCRHGAWKGPKASARGGRLRSSQRRSSQREESALAARCDSPTLLQRAVQVRPPRPGSRRTPEGAQPVASPSFLTKSRRS